jgi:hypothetical protein
MLSLPLLLNRSFARPHERATYAVSEDFRPSRRAHACKHRMAVEILLRLAVTTLSR